MDTDALIIFNYKKLNCRLIFSSLVMLSCAACATHKPYNLPLINEANLSTSGTAMLSERWWVAFDDDELNDHIASALDNNFTLAASWDRLSAAKALAKRQSADLYPRLNLGGDTTRTYDDDGDKSDSFSFGPAASYEIDLWGRIRASRDAEDLRALASEEDYRTAALSLSGNIAITWVRLIEANKQHGLLKNQIDTNEKVLEILSARFDTGQVRSEDILRQQLLIEAVKEEIIDVETNIEILQNQMAVLKGNAPQGYDFVFAKDKDLPVIPAMPDTGVPSDLLNRRPDIRAALLGIEAADKDLAAAVRNQYPNITLSASYLSEAATAGALFSNWVTTLAGGFIAPIIDGGQRRAEIKRNEALRSERVNIYAQSVLEAFQDVENALTQENKQSERVENLEYRHKLAKDTYDLTKIGYFNGASAFIDVLSAQTELQDIERDLITARRLLVEFRIALYRAIAGGFKTPREHYQDTQTNVVRID